MDDQQTHDEAQTFTARLGKTVADFLVQWGAMGDIAMAKPLLCNENELEYTAMACAGIWST